MEWWKAIGICAAFFLFLSPGFILTLPPISGSTKGWLSKGLFHSLETSNASILAHTVVFVVLAGGLLWYLDSSGDSMPPTVQDKSGETDKTDDSGNSAPVDGADNKGE